MMFPSLLQGDLAQNGRLSKRALPSVVPLAQPDLANPAIAKPDEGHHKPTLTKPDEPVMSRNSYCSLSKLPLLSEAMSGAMGMGMDNRYNGTADSMFGSPAKPDRGSPLTPSNRSREFLEEKADGIGYLQSENVMMGGVPMLKNSAIAVSDNAINGIAADADDGHNIVIATSGNAVRNAVVSKAMNGNGIETATNESMNENVMNGNGTGREGSIEAIDLFGGIEPFQGLGPFDGNLFEGQLFDGDPLQGIDFDTLNSSCIILEGEDDDVEEYEKELFGLKPESPSKKNKQGLERLDKRDNPNIVLTSPNASPNAKGSTDASGNTDVTTAKAMQNSLDSLFLGSPAPEADPPPPVEYADSQNAKWLSNFIEKGIRTISSEDSDATIGSEDNRSAFSERGIFPEGGVALPEGTMAFPAVAVGWMGTGNVGQLRSPGQMPGHQFRGQFQIPGSKIPGQFPVPPNPFPMSNGQFAGQIPMSGNQFPGNPYGVDEMHYFKQLNEDAALREWLRNPPGYENHQATKPTIDAQFYGSPNLIPPAVHYNSPVVPLEYTPDVPRGSPFCSPDIPHAEAFEVSPLDSPASPLPDTLPPSRILDWRPDTGIRAITIRNQQAATEEIEDSIPENPRNTDGYLNAGRSLDEDICEAICDEVNVLDHLDMSMVPPKICGEYFHTGRCPASRQAVRNNEQGSICPDFKYMKGKMGKQLCDLDHRYRCRKVTDVAWQCHNCGDVNNYYTLRSQGCRACGTQKPLQMMVHPPSLAMLEVDGWLCHRCKRINATFLSSSSFIDQTSVDQRSSAFEASAFEKQLQQEQYPQQISRALLEKEFMEHTIDGKKANFSQKCCYCGNTTQGQILREAILDSCSSEGDQNQVCPEIDTNLTNEPSDGSNQHEHNDQKAEKAVQNAVLLFFAERSDGQVQRICTSYLTQFGNPDSCRGPLCLNLHPSYEELEQARKAQHMLRTYGHEGMWCKHFFSKSFCPLGPFCPYSHPPLDVVSASQIQLGNQVFQNEDTRRLQFCNPYVGNAASSANSNDPKDTNRKQEKKRRKCVTEPTKFTSSNDDGDGSPERSRLKTKTPDSERSGSVGDTSDEPPKTPAQMLNNDLDNLLSTPPVKVSTRFREDRFRDDFQGDPRLRKYRSTTRKRLSIDNIDILGLDSSSVPFPVRSPIRSRSPRRQISPKRGVQGSPKRKGVPSSPRRGPHNSPRVGVGSSLNVGFGSSLNVGITGASSSSNNAVTTVKLPPSPSGSMGSIVRGSVKSSPPATPVAALSDLSGRTQLYSIAEEVEEVLTAESDERVGNMNDADGMCATPQVIERFAELVAAGNNDGIDRNEIVGREKAIRANGKDMDLNERPTGSNGKAADSNGNHIVGKGRWSSRDGKNQQNDGPRLYQKLKRQRSRNVPHSEENDEYNIRPKKKRLQRHDTMLDADNDRSESPMIGSNDSMFKPHMVKSAMIRSNVSMYKPHVFESPLGPKFDGVLVSEFKNALHQRNFPSLVSSIEAVKNLDQSSVSDMLKKLVEMAEKIVERHKAETKKAEAKKASQ